jgi:hypothetical protein
LIPGETVALYAMTTDQILRNFEGGVRAGGLLGVFFGCLALTLVIRLVETKDPKTGRFQVWNVVVACVSFVIYAYNLGGPFEFPVREVPPGWSAVGGLIVSAFWTAALPWLYQAKAP